MSDKMSVFTRHGDQGFTRLLSGEKILKSSVRIKSIGALDELSAYLGLLRTFEVLRDEEKFLSEIQKDLFKISGILADAKNKFKDKLPKINEQDITKLEDKITYFEQQLPKQKNFILAGGSEQVAFIHIARTVCRRAETHLVELHFQQQIDQLIMQYINRLSDYLYTLARHTASRQGLNEETTG